MGAATVCRANVAMNKVQTLTLAALLLTMPFIVRWPAQVKAGSVWVDPVCQTDVLATFADIVGAKLPADAAEDSVSFHAALTGKAQPPRLPLIHHASNGRFAVREGKWKLVMEHGKTQRNFTTPPPISVRRTTSSPTTPTSRRVSRGRSPAS